MKTLTALSESVMDLDLRTPDPETEQEIPHTGVANDYHADGSRIDSLFDANRLDHFIEKDGQRFAGTHLIIDLWDASRLDELGHVEESLRQATEAAGATLLNIDLHYFTPNGGVSGVAVLAESHISIHTWPECGYAAIDIFMCGDAEPSKAIGVLESSFKPGSIEVGEHRRGVIG